MEVIINAQNVCTFLSCVCVQGDQSLLSQPPKRYLHFSHFCCFIFCQLTRPCVTPSQLVGENLRQNAAHMPATISLACLPSPSHWPARLPQSCILFHISIVANASVLLFFPLISIDFFPLIWQKLYYLNFQNSFSKFFSKAKEKKFQNGFLI